MISADGDRVTELERDVAELKTTVHRLTTVLVGNASSALEVLTGRDEENA